MHNDLQDLHSGSRRTFLPLRHLLVELVEGDEDQRRVEEVVPVEEVEYPIGPDTFRKGLGRVTVFFLESDSFKASPNKKRKFQNRVLGQTSSSFRRPFRQNSEMRSF